MTAERKLGLMLVASSWFFPPNSFAEVQITDLSSLQKIIYEILKLCGSLCNCSFSKICNYARKYWNTYLCASHLFDMQKPFTLAFLTITLLFLTCFCRGNIWTRMSPSGRICCISLYEEAKRAYLDRLKVKKIFMLKFLIRPL